MERLSIGIYWGRKKETVLTISTKLFSLFTLFHKIDPKLGKLKFATNLKRIDSLFDVGAKSKKYVDQLSQAILEDKKSAIQKYHPGITPTVEFHEPIGFVLAFEGVDIKGLLVTMVVGGYGENLPANNLLIKFPSEYNYDFQKIRSLFMIIIEELEPDWGAVMNRKFTEVIAAQKPPEIFVGWMTYFVERNIERIIPNSYEREKFQGGLIVYTTSVKEVFSSENKSHTMKSFELIDLLRQMKVTRASVVRDNVIN